jgi:hypothetical protein
MERIVSWQYAEAIGEAMGIIGPTFERRLCHVHFLTGVDPIYAGLHNYRETPDDLRSYRCTAHVAYPWHCLDTEKRTTVVLPTLGAANLRTVIHELGHCLDEVLGFSHTAKAINEYAATNREEAFAEAFSAFFLWLTPEEERRFETDAATVALLASLGGCTGLG